MGDIRAPDAETARPAHPDSQPPENEVTVLVTGFGPFLKQFPINPSHEIAKALPASLTLTTKTPSPSPSSPPKTTTTRITLTTPSAPLAVAYHPTHAAVPKLLSSARPDLVLHIGLAAGRAFFAIEKSSAKHGYDRNADVDGRRWTARESDHAWRGAPEHLETGLLFEGVWARWRDACEGLEGVVGPGASARDVRRGRGVGTGGEGMEGVPSAAGGGGGVVKGQDVVEVRPSDDVGSYLCGFIYYNSLAWFWEREREKEEEGGVERPVLFLHVPACPEGRDVERGTEITVELIKAMVATWLAQKEKAEAAR
ncbi:hypothetical protein GTA08_BOTSDO06451 [Botryosphaeria dothidea]|uniref:Uncharacterized protein n=1 Tax=Botryosphaeria dothidea TaxID=55169 RepID=A0A8H4IQT4_9PEZI|nr:hypothetical protein GTA08_BOTSDO06451 [Botryosphaeria dothidea]